MLHLLYAIIEIYGRYSGTNGFSCAVVQKKTIDVVNKTRDDGF